MWLWRVAFLASLLALVSTFLSWQINQLSNLFLVPTRIKPNLYWCCMAALVMSTYTILTVLEGRSLWAGMGHLPRAPRMTGVTPRFVRPDTRGGNGNHVLEAVKSSRVVGGATRPRGHHPGPQLFLPTDLRLATATSPCRRGLSDLLP